MLEFLTLRTDMNSAGDSHRIDSPIQAGEQSAPKSPPPNWEGMGEEICCPLCEYNLRGLTQPRCPECGYSFQWDEILDKNRRHHRYIFEHHAERNLWSFLLTLLGGWRTKKFWSELHPLQQSKPKRLAYYRIIILILLVIPVLIDSFWQPSPLLGLRPRGYFGFQPVRWQWAWEAEGNFPWNVFALPLKATAKELLWSLLFASVALPLVTYGLLMIFQQTMRKAKVRREHVRRCITYSADVVLWPVLPLCVLTILNGSTYSAYSWGEEIAWTVLISFILMWVIFAWRLRCAYRYYLRFNHAAATIISVQIIILLGLIVIVYNLK